MYIYLAHLDNPPQGANNSFVVCVLGTPTTNTPSGRGEDRYSTVGSSQITPQLCQEAMDWHSYQHNSGPNPPQEPHSFRLLRPSFPLRFPHAGECHVIVVGRRSDCDRFAAGMNGMCAPPQPVPPGTQDHFELVGTVMAATEHPAVNSAVVSHEHFRRLTRWVVRRMTRGGINIDDRIDEIVNEVVLRFFRGANAPLHRYDGSRSCFSSWVSWLIAPLVSRIATRDLRRWLRRGVPLHLVSQSALASLDRGLTAAEQEEDLFALHAAVQRLPSDQSRALLLRYRDGWSVGEIATIMVRKVGAVSALLSRARKGLGEILEQRV